jgi:parallel beta-helix repeat protein
MKAGSKITGNTASNNGGGVYVFYSSFTMEDGIISGNSAYFGGGVSVDDGGGDFIMEGGEISGNTASLGGGVYVHSGGSFSKTGGTVYGDTNSTHTEGSPENTATFYGNTWGHAVYYRKDSSNHYYRDADLDIGDDIDTGSVPVSATGSYDSTNWIKK